LQDMGAVCLNPLLDQRLSGILTVNFMGKDNAQLHKLLMEAGVICAQRGGGIRLSPHFHTTREVLDDAVDALECLLEALKEWLSEHTKRETVSPVLLTIEGRYAGFTPYGSHGQT